jgi:hypothetical protein
MMGESSKDAVNNGAWSLIRKSRLNQTMLAFCVIVLAIFLGAMTVYGNTYA